MYEGTNHELPVQNPVQKIANDYYIVNVDNEFEPEILEFYLKTEFKKMNITTDFEYAMYNCQSDEMIYGDYITLTKKNQNAKRLFISQSIKIWYIISLCVFRTKLLIYLVRCDSGLSFRQL